MDKNWKDGIGICCKFILSGFSYITTKIIFPLEGYVKFTLPELKEYEIIAME